MRNIDKTERKPPGSLFYFDSRETTEKYRKVLSRLALVNSTLALDGRGGTDRQCR